MELSTGELIHLREDDIIPNKGSFEKVYDFITCGIPLKAAAAGVYLNRNVNFKKLVGGFYNEETPRQTEDLSEVISNEPFEIDFTGTGFLMFWKDLCPIFEPYINKIQAHDWAWGVKLKKNGGKLYMLPDAICKHYHNETEYLEYNASLEINKRNTFTKPVVERKIENVNVNGLKKCIIIK